MLERQKLEVLKVLDALALECHDQSRKSGFWDNPLDKIADGRLHTTDLELQAAVLNATKCRRAYLAASELCGELCEALRKPGASDHIPRFSLEEEEVADVLIRLFDYAGGYNLRLGDAVLAKIEFNATREKMHGKKF